jgi:hypothetical protein
MTSSALSRALSVVRTARSKVVVLLQNNRQMLLRWYQKTHNTTRNLGLSPILIPYTNRDCLRRPNPFRDQSRLVRTTLGKNLLNDEGVSRNCQTNDRTKLDVNNNWNDELNTEAASLSRRNGKRNSGNK